MDPISAVSFAASVVQLVQFSISSAKVVYEITQRGSSSDIASASYCASHLSTLIASIHDSQPRRGRELSREEAELQDVGKKCEEIALKLQEELQKLQIKKSDSRVLGSVKVAAKTFYKKGKIEKMMDELERLRRVLETGLLTSLRQRVNMQTLVTEQGFQDLHDDVKQVVSRLSAGETTLDALVRSESETTRQHVTDQTNRVIERLEYFNYDKTMLESLKQSLFFPQINDREEQIEQEFDGIDDSNEWVFQGKTTAEHTLTDQEPQDKPRWSSFTDWLEYGSGVYWISGKAGSGKSTLMNHIVSQETTAGLLQTWSQDRELVKLSFFFWNSGTKLQRTTEGLLRSLNYQMLCSQPDLVKDFKPDDWHVWTQKQLTDLLKRFLTQTQLPLAICMFIDGLDEFEGEYKMLIKMIQESCNHAYIKVCVSSRPLIEFENAFSNQPMLRLQDLTYRSIRKYAEAQLLPVTLQPHSSPKDRDRVHSLMSELVERAEGVFLWVVLAVRTLRQGIEDMADLDEVEKVIYGLPPKIEDLYMSILGRIKPFCRRDAARFFLLILRPIPEDHWYQLTLLAFYFIENDRRTADEPLDAEIYDEEDLVQKCKIAQARLLSHTLGLVSLTTPSEQHSTREPADEGSRRYLFSTQLSLFHRSFTDFLLSHQAAQEFLDHSQMTDDAVYLSTGRGLLKLFFSHNTNGQKISSRLWFGDGLYMEGDHSIFIAALKMITQVERRKQAAQVTLMDSLYSFLPELQSMYMEVVKGNWSSAGFIHSDVFLRSMWPRSFDLLADASFCDMQLYTSRAIGMTYDGSELNQLQKDPAEYLLSLETLTERAFSWDEQANASVWPELNTNRLETCLVWIEAEAAVAHPGPQHEALVQGKNLASTFILWSYDILHGMKDEARAFINKLLLAGADPMARMVVKNTAGLPDDLSGVCMSAWERWLSYVWQLCLLPRRSRYSVSGEDECWKLTHVMLSGGADIYQMQDSTYRPSTTQSRLQFEIVFKFPAICILRELFKFVEDACLFLESVSRDRTNLEMISVGIKKYSYPEDELERTILLDRDASARRLQDMFNNLDDSDYDEKMCIEILEEHDGKSSQDSGTT